MSNKKSTPAVRILAIILSILMVVSMAFYTIYMIVDSIKQAQAEKEKEEQEQQEGGENTAAAISAYDFIC